MDSYDVIVLGAGPGGYEAALYAAKEGLKTAVVDRGTVGGTCLHCGCIPTKTLLHTAEIYEEAKNAGEIGLSAKEVSIDYEKLQAYKNQVVSQLSGGIEYLFKKSKIDYYQGEGKVTGPHTIEVTGAEGTIELSGEHLLIATGSEPVVLPLPGMDLAGVMDSTALLDLDRPLGSLIIVGGGVIGMEFASLYASLGTRVSVIEAADRILGTLDKEFGQNLKLILKKKEVDIHTGASLKEIRPGKEEALCCVYMEKDEEKTQEAEAVLIAVGRRPSTKGLFSEDFQVELERGRIIVNERYQTSVPSVYAIGDVIGGIQLAHVATAEGYNAIAAMMGKESADFPVSMKAIPSCVYTSPEIATVGISADDVKAMGLQATVHKYLMSANGKTVLTRQERSFLRIVTDDETGVILGAQMMCARATDMIGEFSSAIVNGLKLQDLSSVIRPHPTFNEAVWELARE